MDWNKLLTRSGHSVEEFFDGLRHRLRRRAGFMKGLQVLPYRTYGTGEKFYLKGRVLQERPTFPTHAADSLWKNLLGSYRRFNSREVPDAVVEVRFGDALVRLQTDEEGYFEGHLEGIAAEANAETWKQIEIKLLAPSLPEGQSHSATGHVLVPSPKAQFAVISDIDDTILVTEARRAIKMFASTFLRNAHTRLPFPGVAALYRAFQSGSSDLEVCNPIFYVSSGPWNLYDLLRDFFEANQIPVGPLCLQDFGFDREKFLKSSHMAHKERTIKQIMEMYPHLSFILLGDSGQKDPEIYLKILQEIPARIKAIYIRDVADAGRTSEVQRLFEEARKHGGELLLIRSTYEAARHASEKGWVSRKGLEAVRTEMNLPEDPDVKDLTDETESIIKAES